MRDRVIAAFAIAVPVIAGLGYLYAYAAPRSYLIVNGAALAVALAAIAIFREVRLPLTRRLLLLLLTAVLFIPLITGPFVSGIARWLPLGSFALNAGLLAAPALVVVAADEPHYAPGILGIALLAVLLQPDMAMGAALTVAGLGFYDATKDWRYGVFVAVGFIVSLVSAMHGELAPQPFVERVIDNVSRTNLLAALGLAAALLISFYLIVSAFPGRAGSRKALGGCLFGFVFAGHVSNYPSPLIGYGAAPILGFGFALALLAAKGTDQPVADFSAVTGA